MERIAFVIPNLLGGGAARVASILMAEWIAMGHAVHLLTYEEHGADVAYPLDSRIVRHPIGAAVSPPGITGFVANNASRVARLRRTLRQIGPTAIVSFLDEANVVSVLASRGMRVPVVVGERNHPGRHRSTAIKERIRNLVYPHADRLCVQTRDIARWYRDNVGIEAVVIPNPVEVAGEEWSKAGRAREPLKRAISLGRLEPQKGFDLLVDAFALIAGQVPDWQLAIYGEGSERGTLAQRIARHGLGARVTLAGHTRETARVLMASDLYVHAARYEGYPNAVLEALACGLCVVATDCPGATAEILQNGAYGLLAPSEDAPALAGRMLRAMQDDALRAGFAARAREAVRALGPRAIAQRWIDEIGRCRLRGGEDRQPGSGARSASA